MKALRELASLFVAGYAIFLMVVLACAGQGPQGRQVFGRFFRDILESGPSLIVHLIVLAFVILHSVSTFHDMSKMIQIGRGEKKVRPALIAEVSYGIWIIVSALIFIGLISWSQTFELGG